MINAVDPALTETVSDSSLFDGLGGDAFLQLLIAQLQYQDPLAPTDPASMLEQTSQFANVEAIQKLNELQTQVLGFSQFQTAAAMIGAQVTAEDANLGTVTGQVVGVTATPTGPVLRLAGGTEIDVLDVIAVDLDADDNPTPSTGADSGTSTEGSTTS